jgi:hypothetical protein
VVHFETRESSGEATTIFIVRSKVLEKREKSMV